MSDITDADREAVSRLIEVIRDAKAEGADIKDCHERGQPVLVGQGGIGHAELEG